MELTETFIRLFIALGLGMLVGLQRESVAHPLAGLRTFALITVFGFICGHLSVSLGGWIVAAGFIALGGVLVISIVVDLRTGSASPGMTTEVAILLMFAVGAYLVQGSTELAVVVVGGVAVLLQFKRRLHGLVQRFGEEELAGVMRFVLIALVILPILPNRTFGPFDVLNPYEIWLVVVLIVGISLGGYIAYKFVGQQAGVLLGGILGGVISSTATTVSYARRTRRVPESSGLAAAVIVIASTIVLIRVLVEIAVVGPTLLPAAAGPLGVYFAVFVLLALASWFSARRDENQMPAQENPTELKPAIIFALLYAVVLVGVAAAKSWWGSEGLYAVALISGLTDVDAITLSTAKLVEAGRVDTTQGWKVIVIATMANLLFKGGTVALLGTRATFRRVALLFGLAIAAGLAILFLWP